ncbi:hypothetical protein C7266_06255 [Klebsiella variicola]|uniref:HEPN domain-containing protein n=2 Tax=Klebsiella variicola TaxID=244366 RepID=UPI001C7F5C2B|nr:HEPN domain-containing protein [Klebsiella variicola]MBX4606916.1 hypothetical protein [Klebsiella variicola]
MQLSLDGEKQFAKLFMELARAYKLWVDDHKAYFQEMEKDNLIAITINAPHNMQEEMSGKYKRQEPCIYQLHHTSCSLSIMRKLAILIRRSSNLNCLPYELHPVIEAIVYEYVNVELDSFIDCVVKNGEHCNIKLDVLKKIATDRVRIFKKEFSSSVYQFPVTMFNLSGELKLSDSIRLLPVDTMDLAEEELALYKDTRTFDYNYYLEVHVKTRCSKQLALQQAEKARDATYNILKLLATRLSPRAIPLLTSKDRITHPFDFYRHGKDENNISNTINYNFPVFQFDSKEFWLVFHQSKNVDSSLIGIVFKIVELLLLPNFSSQRVVERLERSLLWYGDAVTESSFYQQVQKLVSSMEALVNFHDDDTTETFKRRVTHLNITHVGLDDEIRNKAKQLYDARSKIVHGSSVDERFDFCIISFCSETLLRAIYYFSLFGFERTGFNKTLPKFLDELPKRAVLRCDEKL